MGAHQMVTKEKLYEEPAAVPLSAGDNLLDSTEASASPFARA